MTLQHALLALLAALVPVGGTLVVLHVLPPPDVNSPAARPATSALPPGVVPVTYARGFSGDLGRGMLLVWFLSSFWLLVPGIIFERRHPHVELVTTSTEVFVVRMERRLLRRTGACVESRHPLDAVSIVRLGVTGGVVAVASARHWIMPGHGECIERAVR